MKIFRLMLPLFIHGFRPTRSLHGTGHIRKHWLVIACCYFFFLRFRRIAHNGEINTVESNRRWLVAKESAVKLPLALNYVKDITSLLPFEEPCHVPSFTLPHYPDRFINHDMKKRGEPPVACGGVQHVRDSLAVPTDVVSAHQNPVISNDVFSFPKEDTEESNVFESESELDYSFSQSDSFEETNNIQHSSDSALFDGIVDLLMMTGRSFLVL
jgi:glutamate synthase domain-containing protein 1